MRRDELSVLQDLDWVNVRLHLRPADTPLTYGRAKFDLLRIRVLAGGP